MLKKLIHRIAAHRHPWRYMKFDELAEVYTSMTMRSLGFGVIGLFVPIFLYNSGIDLQSIFYFYGIYFLLRIVTSFVAAFVVGRIGPKHTIAVSTVLMIIFFSLLLSYDSLRWPLLMLAFFYNIANTLFFIAYNTDFSKIKSKKHGGKELGWLYIFERGGAATGPLIGGLIASMFSPRLAIVFAMLVLFGSIIPLLMTNEPVKVHQKITFRGFNPMKYARNFMALSAYNVENNATLVMWPLFVGVFIFTGEQGYAKVGGLFAAATITSMFAAHFLGRAIDNKKGYVLLKYGVILNAVTHGIRTIVTASGGAIAVSVLNEPTTLTYKMPIVKGLFDEADNDEKYRIVYLVWQEMITAAAKAAYCLSLYLACFIFDSESVLRFGFAAVGVISLLILTQRFPALKKV